MTSAPCYHIEENIRVLAFKATTEEKQITANLSRVVLNHLAHRLIVLNGEKPALVADIGSGPCGTIIGGVRRPSMSVGC